MQEKRAGLVILDFAYTGAILGHHFTLNETLLGRATAQFASVELWGARSLDCAADRRLRAVFRAPTYYRTTRGLDFLAKESSIARSVVEDIKDALTAGASLDGKHVFIHTAFSAHLVGVFEMLRALAPRSVAVQLHHVVEYMAEDCADQRRSQFAAAVALSEGMPVPTTFLFAQDMLRDYWHRQLERIRRSAILPYALPLPLESLAGQLANQPRAAGDARVNFGFVCGASADRGFKLLLDALPALAPMSKTLRLSLTLANPAQAVLQQLQPYRDWVSVTAGPLESADYARNVAACDVILLPYDPLAYAVRGSGVMFDALALGRPLLTTAGSSLATTCREEAPGAAVLMHEWTREGLARAVRRTVRDLPSLRSAAMAAAPVVCKRHSSSAYLASLAAALGEQGRT